MSMVYDPITREFRPRESRAEKPAPADLPAATNSTAPAAPIPPRPISAEDAPRLRRRVNMRRRRRRREIFFYTLFILGAGVLIWATVWAWSHSRRSSMPEHDQSPVSRFWQSTTE